MRRIGGAREFSTFALLLLCLAVAVGMVVHRSHRTVNGAATQPATAAHAASAPNSRADAQQASPASSATNDDYSVWLAESAGKLDSSAQGIVYMAINPVWDTALGLSNQVLSYIADTMVNPLNGDRVIFNAAPGTFNMAVAILALAMVAIVLMALAGPVYVTWKSWRLSRAHLFRYRSH
jgi:hypothetical protein